MSAVQTQLNRALEALNQGDNAVAIGVLQAVLTQHAQQADALQLLALAYKRVGRLNEALALFATLLQHYPQADFLPVIQNNYGNALIEAGQPLAALSQFDAAIARQAHYPHAHNNRGNALKGLGRWQEAALAYRLAIAQLPDFAEALNNLGGVCHKLGQWQAAEQYYQAALAARPGYDQAEFNLGNLRQDQEDPLAALQHFSAALRANPGHVEALVSLVRGKQMVCDWAGLPALFERMRNGVQSRQDGRVYPFAFVAIPSNLIEQQDCAVQWGRMHVKPLALGQAPPVWPRQPKTRLRIGYLSSDFHDHATAYLMAEVFELHQRANFEIFAYSAGPDDGKAMRQRLLAAFDQFVEVREASPAQIAARIRADEIDILVDLKGYTKDTRSSVLAFRAAPIQVSYLGYPGTLGLDEVDYILGDATVTPLEHAPFYTEKLALLADCYQCNDRQRHIGPPVSRAACGLPDTGVVWCCFNHTYKLSEAYFAVWCRLLLAVPGSVLWLLRSNAVAENNLRQQAVAHGVDPARLIFAPVAALPDHLSRLRHADIFLDTAPYNAHTTSSDALWAGVPVITVTGETFASRVATSLVRAVGLPQLATASLEAYFELALHLANTPDTRQAMRQHLTSNPTALPLFDTPRFVRGLEALYQGMWQRHVAGEPPAHMAANLRDAVD